MGRCGRVNTQPLFLVVAVLSAALACAPNPPGLDAGSTLDDAGPDDAGEAAEASVPDASGFDAGLGPDAGVRDASVSDAGLATDAGELDAGSLTPGSITNISLNTRADINPRNDATLNPLFPNRAPWEASVGWGASALSAYCGAVMATHLGAQGTLLQWGAPGHSTNLEATCWLGFDVATRRWKLITRPLPNGVFAAYQAGVTPAPSQLDHTWGDWKGDSVDWPAAFRQPGYDPPAGSHTRNSFVYVPPTVAGNAHGKVVVAWHPTGNTSGTGLRGSWLWDADTGLFSRTANLKPSAGSAVGGLALIPDAGVVLGHNSPATFTSNVIDVLDLATATWTRRTATSSLGLAIDSTNFIVGDLFVHVHNDASATPMTFSAAPISAIRTGSAWSWSPLTVSATSWPTKGTSTFTTQWTRCPENDAFYAVNRTGGSHTLWKLTAPAPPNDTAGLLSGTWRITTETLSGDPLEDAAFDYGRLQWVPALHAFLWLGDLHTSPVQAIRPSGL